MLKSCNFLPEITQESRTCGHTHITSKCIELESLLVLKLFDFALEPEQLGFSSSIYLEVM